MSGRLAAGVRMAARVTGGAVLVAALAGCWSSEADDESGAASGDAAEPQVSSTSTPSPSDAATSDASPTSDSTPAPTSTLPDPAPIVGAELRDEGAGSTAVLVDGAPVAATTTVIAACVPDGSADPCPFALYALVPEDPPRADLARTTEALLLLLSAAGEDAGVPLWTVVDAVTAPAPGGSAAYLTPCFGPDSVLGYAADTTTVGETYGLTAAWTPNPDRTAIISLDPAGITCESMG